MNGKVRFLSANIKVIIAVVIITAILVNEPVIVDMIPANTLLACLIKLPVGVITPSYILFTCLVIAPDKAMDPAIINTITLEFTNTPVIVDIEPNKIFIGCLIREPVILLIEPLNETEGNFITEPEDIILPANCLNGNFIRFPALVIDPINSLNGVLIRLPVIEI